MLSRVNEKIILYIEKRRNKNNIKNFLVKQWVLINTLKKKGRLKLHPINSIHFRQIFGSYINYRAQCFYSGRETGSLVNTKEKHFTIKTIIIHGSQDLSQFTGSLFLNKEMFWARRFPDIININYNEMLLIFTYLMLVS